MRPDDMRMAQAILVMTGQALGNIKAAQERRPNRERFTVRADEFQALVGHVAQLGEVIQYIASLMPDAAYVSAASEADLNAIRAAVESAPGGVMVLSADGPAQPPLALYRDMAALLSGLVEHARDGMGAMVIDYAPFRLMHRMAELAEAADPVACPPTLGDLASQYLPGGR